MSETLIDFSPGRRVHFIGIGGAGLSAIARVLINKGCIVSGSDMKTNPESLALRELGATTFEGHAASNIGNAELLIVSSAVKPDHVEIAAAQAAGIPVYKRSDIMASVMAGYRTIGLAGTHGKTTTTSMTAHILIQAGEDPCYIVGGVMANTGTNAGVGKGKHFVIEADEYDNMFHGLRPHTAVVTSIEFDHPDFFATNDEMIASFDKYMSLLPDDGTLIGYAEDAIMLDRVHKRRAKGLNAISYGMSDAADWRITDIVGGEHETTFTITTKDGPLGSITLPVPGKHNILNATAATAAAVTNGVPFAACAAALRTFKGSGRRFDLRADINGIAIVDDYAHHPTAVATTIDAARQRYPNRTLWAVWQPHTYSRTKALWKEFGASFKDADHVVVTDVFGSREKLDPTVQSSDFVRDMPHEHKHHVPTLAEAAQFLHEHVKAPAVVLIMSAGDAPQIGKDLEVRLRG